MQRIVYRPFLDQSGWEQSTCFVFSGTSEKTQPPNWRFKVAFEWFATQINLEMRRDLDKPHIPKVPQAF